MLETKDTTPLFLNTHQTKVGDMVLQHGKFYHLYITSDEEIKEGDCVLFGNHVGKVRRIYTKENYQLIEFDNSSVDVQIIHCKKIIATTDKLPIEPYQGHFEGIDCTNYLPQPSQQFIEKYIEEYNKGQQITECLVEYEEGKLYSGNKGLIIKEWLKINPKYNTITIKKLKDSYTREEVEILCRRAYREGQNYDAPDQCTMSDKISIEEFIRQNL